MFNRISANHLSWGILLHLQGRDRESLRELAEARKRSRRSRDIQEVCAAIRNHVRYGSRERIQDRKVLKERGNNLLTIVRCIDNLLSGRGFKQQLAVEPNVPPAGIIREGPASGYSRDPFLRVLKADRKSAMALAATLYLLRGYVSFFCRPNSARDFNAAKVALNDLFQCGQLGWRLYRSLDSCHASTGDQRLYHARVLTGWKPGSRPGSSDYFVWSLLQMVELQRGNIYRQIEYLEESARCYRHFHQRLQLLETQAGRRFLRTDSGVITDETWHDFITSSVIRAYSEASKVQFDQGYFLESLKSQLIGLGYVVINSLLSTKTALGADGIPYPVEHVTTCLLALELLTDMDSIIRFLEAENRQQVFKVEQILSRFHFERPSGTAESFYPDRLRGLVHDAHLELTADILARMGFTLLTLLGKPEGMVDTKAGWLRQYAEAQRLLQSGERQILQLDHGAILSRLLGISPSTDSASVGQSIEQRYLAYLRNSDSTRVGARDSTDHIDFFQKVLWSTTENSANLTTIPRRAKRHMMRRGYRWRRVCGDLSCSTVHEGIQAAIEARPHPEAETRGPQNKLVVLRRWQSFSPRIPRPNSHRFRGGGYFLVWQGKGIVIDPGYDFIQNFYEEGFSLDDIDAVIVTHSHPDHDDDLSTLTTLCKEWDEYYRMCGESPSDDDDLPQHLPRSMGTVDFLLSESSALKFASWLKSSQVEIGRVIPLPSVWWDKNSKLPWRARLRGAPAILRLRGRDGYFLNIEIIPAWHDDVISRTEAVGLKFHLYQPNGIEPCGYVGITGDTGAYGYDLAQRDDDQPPKIVEFYRDCDVLVAHLGDIKVREITTKLERTWDEHPLEGLFAEWFPIPASGNPSISRRRIDEFVTFLVALDLVPSSAITQTIKAPNQPEMAVSKWLRNKHRVRLTRADLVECLRNAATEVLCKMGFGSQSAEITTVHNNLVILIQKATRALSDKSFVSASVVSWSLLAYLVQLGAVRWQYPYHLGIHGIFELFQAMRSHWVEKGRSERVFVVAELPEELASYRNLVAWHLNELARNRVPRKRLRRWVHAFTGDIGLHVRLDQLGDTKLTPAIRCTYCNYNNESVLAGDNYHDPSEMAEVPIKRLDSAMIYLCRKHGFGRHKIETNRLFLSRPNLRVV